MGTIRFRLTISYAALFLVVGVALIVLVNVLVERAMPPVDRGFAERLANRAPGPPLGSDLSLADVRDLAQEARTQARNEALDTLLVQSSMALAVMLVASIGVGWFIAGRMLRPVASIADTVRRIDEGRLDERVALQGPKDELKELADQFDAMLDRLDASFRAQREFVANASHELRTPLSIIRTELDVTLADPDASADEIRQSADVIRRATARSEALIGALLTLERADAPRQASEAVDLASIAGSAIERWAAELQAGEVEVTLALAPATVVGDRLLIEQMIANLVANAAAYAEPDASGGRWIRMVTAMEPGAAVVRVANSSGPVDGELLESLFDRFRRLDSSRSRDSGGHGLGLSIVRAVARHHGGEAVARSIAGPGVEFEVRIPAAA